MATLPLSLFCVGGCGASSRLDGVNIAEAAFGLYLVSFVLEVWSRYGCLLVLVGEVQRNCWARLAVYAFHLVMGLLAALASLALVASHAAVAAGSGGAFALRVTVAALVEVRAAHLLGEDVDHILLLLCRWLAVVGTGGSEALEEVSASIIWLHLGSLGLSWMLLEEAGVDLALEEVVDVAASRVLGRAPGVQFGFIFASLSLILWLGGDEELAWSDSRAHAAHPAALVEDLEAGSLSLSCLSYLPENLLSVDW